MVGGMASALGQVAGKVSFANVAKGVGSDDERVVLLNRCSRPAVGLGPRIPEDVADVEKLLDSRRGDFVAGRLGGGDG